MCLAEPGYTLKQGLLLFNRQELRALGRDEIVRRTWSVGTQRVGTPGCSDPSNAEYVRSGPCSWSSTRIYNAVGSNWPLRVERALRWVYL